MGRPGKKQGEFLKYDKPVRQSGFIHSAGDVLHWILQQIAVLCRTFRQLFSWMDEKPLQEVLQLMKAEPVTTGFIL